MRLLGFPKCLSLKPLGLPEQNQVFLRGVRFFVGFDVGRLFNARSKSSGCSAAAARRCW